MTDTPAPIFSSLEPLPEVQNVSVWSRLINVIVAPSEAFDGIVAIEKKTTLWLIPMLLSIVLTVGVVSVMMVNPAAQQKIRQTMIEKMEEQVKSGAMTQDQADKAIDMGANIGRIGGIVGPIFAVPVMWIILALVMYLIVSFILGGEVTFMNVFIVIALASVIGMLEVIVTGFMQYAMADLNAQPSLGMMMSAQDHPYLHAILGRINPFSFWWLAVIAIGFSKISNISQRKATMGVVGAWIVFSAIAVGLAGLLPMFQFGK